MKTGEANGAGAPLQSLEAEQALLGCLLIDSAAWPRVANIVAEDFSCADHRLIFAAIAALARDGASFDPTLVAEQLERQQHLEAAGGLARLSELARETPTAANVGTFAERVVECAALRRLRELTEERLHGQELRESLERQIARLKPAGAPIDQAATDEVRGMKFDSLSELAAAPTATKVALVTDLLYPGAWLLVGRPKIGKSWLLLQLALAVAERETFLGFACPATDVEVLCIFGEDDNARIQSRLAALGVARAPHNTHVVNQQLLFDVARRYAPTFTFAEFIQLWLDKHPKVRLVLVDTEATVRQVWESERGQDREGSRVIETDYKQTRTFDEMALRRELVVILVNHASKRKGTEWIDPHELINRANTALAGASGSIALADPPDADPFDTKAKTRVLAVRGRDLKEDLLLAVHQDENMPCFVSDGVYSEVRQTQVETQLMEALEELMTETPAGEYVTTDDLASCTGKNRSTVKRALTRMLAKGRTTWRKSRVSVKRGKGGGVRLDPIEP